MEERIEVIRSVRVYLGDLALIEENSVLVSYSGIFALEEEIMGG